MSGKATIELEFDYDAEKEDIYAFLIDLIEDDDLAYAWHNSEED